MTNATPADTAQDAQRALTELGRIILGAQPLVQTLERVAQLTQTVVPHARDVSVTLLEEPAEGRPAKASTVAFTGHLAVDLDERQYKSGFGPCMDAAVSGETITVDTSDDEVYVDFSALARRRGVGHTLSVALPIAQRTIGALNIYGAGEPFTARETQLAHEVAGSAAVALANAAAFSSTAELAKNLQLAMESRAVIEQAKGLVMGQRHCSADEAFTILRKTSQQSNLKLRTLCQNLVDRAVDEGR